MCFPKPEDDIKGTKHGMTLKTVGLLYHVLH